VLSIDFKKSGETTAPLNTQAAAKLVRGKWPEGQNHKKYTYSAKKDQ